MKRKGFILILAFFAFILSGQVIAQEHHADKRLESALDLYRKGALLFGRADVKLGNT
jgi:hypothetical protein